MPEQLPEPGTFAAAVQSLDMALTGKSAQQVAQSWRNQGNLQDPFAWAMQTISATYYLSDGGYSRIGLNDYTGKLFLTSNSRDEVFAKWEQCGELIKAVESYLTEFYECK